MRRYELSAAVFGALVGLVVIAVPCQAEDTPIDKLAIGAVTEFSGDPSLEGLVAVIERRLARAADKAIEAERSTFLTRMAAAYPSAVIGFIEPGTGPPDLAEFDALAVSAECPVANQSCADYLRVRDIAARREAALSELLKSSLTVLAAARRDHRGDDEAARSVVVTFEAREAERERRIEAGLSGWVESGKMFATRKSIREAVRAKLCHVHQELSGMSCPE